MINLIYTPQQSDIYITEYVINNDILTVKMNDLEENFDFTGLAEGVSEEIIAEILPINPIKKVEKIGETVNIIAIYHYYIYGDIEKSLFEAVQYGKD